MLQEKEKIKQQKLAMIKVVNSQIKYNNIINNKIINIYDSNSESKSQASLDDNIDLSEDEFKYSSSFNNVNANNVEINSDIECDRK